MIAEKGSGQDAACHRHRQPGEPDEIVRPEQENRKARQINRDTGEIEARESRGCGRIRACTIGWAARCSQRTNPKSAAAGYRQQHECRRCLAPPRCCSWLNDSNSVLMPSASRAAPTTSTGSRSSGRDTGGNPPEEQQRGQCDRRAKPEHRRPTPELDEQPRRADGPAADPSAYISVNTPTARLRLSSGKSPITKRRRAADDQRGADPLQKTAEQQPAVTRRHGAEKIRDAAPQQADAKYPAVAEDVADPPKGEHQAGVGQDIADDDPLDHLDRQAEVRRDVGERDVDRGVERDDRCPQTDQGKAQQLRGVIRRARLMGANLATRHWGIIIACECRKVSRRLNPAATSFVLAVHGGAGRFRGDEASAARAAVIP